MAEIITDGSQKELKKHGSDEFPLLVSNGILNADQKISGGLFGGNPGIVKTGWRSSFYRYCNDAWGIETECKSCYEAAS